MPWLRELSTGFALLAALAVGWPSGAAADEANPVTARIILGPMDGMANPSTAGHARTGGGNIQVLQPSPDTLVVRMNGNTAAMGSTFVTGTATMDFLEQLQFAVEFSEPGHLGQLLMQSRVQGLLVSHGKHATAGMVGAVATLSCGPEELVNMPLPERMVYGPESVAVNLSQGPVCVPIQAGCFSLRQQLRIIAAIAKGCCLGGRATAEFSSTALPGGWQGTTYPFASVDRQELGYLVTLRVVPRPAAKTPLGPSLGQTSPRAGVDPRQTLARTR